MEALFKKTIKHPWLILLVSVIVSAAFMTAIKSKSRMETDLDKYMPQDHPAFVYSDLAEEWFDIKDGIIIAIENPQKTHELKLLWENWAKENNVYPLDGRGWNEKIAADITKK